MGFLVNAPEPKITINSEEHCELFSINSSLMTIETPHYEKKILTVDNINNLILHLGNMVADKEKGLSVKPLSAKIKSFDLYDVLKPEFRDILTKEFPKAEFVRVVFYLPPEGEESGQYIYIGHESRTQFKEKVIEVECQDSVTFEKTIEVLKKAKKGGDNSGRI